MTRKAYRDSEGKLVILNTRNDECLYSGKWVAGVEQNRFNELYVHTAKSGKKILYIVNVTYWQGENNTIDDPTELDIRQWIEERYSWFSAEELKRLAELGYNFEDTA